MSAGAVDLTRAERLSPESAGNGESRGRRRRPPFPAEDRRRVLAAVWLTAGDRWRLRFGVMLGLSVVIASTGLLADSPAVVIGAMLIAPLMTPVLGFAVALSMGWARHMTLAAVTVVAASAGSVVLAWALATVLPGGAGPLTHELVSRTAPSLLDLLVALAAGAAGAYATIREDVSAALPGVAVAVALVPPLATVGVTLQLGQADLAQGAVMLYVANLVAIVLASVVVLLACGFVPIPRLRAVKRRVVAATAGVAVATAVVAATLSGSVRDTVDEASTLRAVNDQVVRWLGPGTELEVRHISVNGANVVVELAGSKAPPPTSALADSLVSAVGPEAAVQVRWSQRSSQAVPSGPTVPAAAPASAEPFRPLVLAWLQTGGSAASTVSSLSLKDDDLTIEVGGPVPPPQVTALAGAVAKERGRPTKVTVKWTPRQEFAASSDGSIPAIDVAVRARAAVDAWARTHPGVTILGVSTRNGVPVVDLASEGTPPDTDTLVAAVKAQTGTTPVVRFAPLQRVPGPA